MIGILRASWFEIPDADVAAERGRPPARVAADWPLMCDILSHRMDTPEHLIRWRRASGEDGTD